MRIIAIDPGPKESAWMVIDGGRVYQHAIEENRWVSGILRDEDNAFECVVIEGIASYGMAVGADVFDTCIWIGRFIEAFPGFHHIVYRRDVKMHLCGSAKAKDANIRQALIDRYGPGKEAAIGKKATPGPLYGIKSHEWSALAVGLTYLETQGAAE